MRPNNDIVRRLCQPATKTWCAEPRVTWCWRTWIRFIPPGRRSRSVSIAPINDVMAPRVGLTDARSGELRDFGRSPWKILSEVCTCTCWYVLSLSITPTRHAEDNRFISCFIIGYSTCKYYLFTADYIDTKMGNISLMVCPQFISISCKTCIITLQCQSYFGILNHFGVIRECNGQRDGQTRLLIAYAALHYTVYVARPKIEVGTFVTKTELHILIKHIRVFWKLANRIH